MDLVPLKVKIGLRDNGMHAFPAFNSISASLRGGVDWSNFVDRFGGWHYDQVCGHDKEEQGSPRGCWNGLLFVPEDFANAAVSQFPDQCEIIDETDAEIFYNERAHVRDAEIREDTTVLQSLAAKKALGMELDSSDNDALDPDHPALGRRRNTKKTYAGFKSERGMKIKAQLEKA
jgi:hypothetical protein